MRHCTTRGSMECAMIAILICLMLRDLACKLREPAVSMVRH